MRHALSNAERRALTWLSNYDGAEIDRHGRLHVGDDVCRSQPQTFLRLILRGYVERTGMPGRAHVFNVSNSGEIALLGKVS